VVDGALSVTSQRDDPIIRARGLQIDPTVHKYLRFSIKNDTPSDYVQFYFFDASNKAWYIPFSVESNSDQFVEYEIDIANLGHQDSDFENYTDAEKYTKLRFDPMNNVTVNTVEIDYIILSRYSKEDVLPEIVEEISIAGKKVQNFEPAAPNETLHKVNVFRDAYDALSTDDIELVFGDEYADTVAEIKLEEVKDRKIVDINVLCGDVGRSYRLVLKAVDKVIYVMLDSCEIANKKLTYSGYVIDDDGNVVVCPVTVLAHVKGYDIHENIKYVNVMMTNEDGEFGGEVLLYDTETEPLMFEMEIAFDIMGGEATVFEYALYINNAKINASLEEMTEGDLDVLEFMSAEDNEKVFEKAGVWLDLYENQDDETKAEINSKLEPYRSSMTAENMAETVNGSILATILGELDTSEVWGKLVDIDKNMNALEVNGKRFSELDDSEQKWVTENLIENNENGTNSYEELFDEVRKSMLLNEVNSAKYMELKELLLSNTEILENEMTKLKNEDSVKVVDKAMKAVILEADKAPFETIDALIKSVNEALSDASESSSGGGGGGGGGSSSGGKGGNTVTVANPEKEETEKSDENKDVEVQLYFKDMNGFEWAENAVTELYNKGVVKGTGDGRFEPGRTVTREEFVKMVVEAFKLGTASINGLFEDVKDDDWFAPYIAVATEKGVVNGVSQTCFGTGMTITREDMATIIYRTARMLNKEFRSSGAGFEFSDWIEVAQYAKEAVGMLYGNGIVNGTGDGSFAPRACATRAEASVIIFRCMEEL